MNALDYCETKQFLDQIAIERGQYCYDYLKNLERKLSMAREALEHLCFHSGRTVYEMEDAAKSALKEIGE